MEEASIKLEGVKSPTTPVTLSKHQGVIIIIIIIIIIILLFGIKNVFRRNEGTLRWLV